MFSMLIQNCWASAEDDDGSPDVHFGTLFVLRLLFLVDNM